METHIHFQSTTSCPSFSPNVFKKDLCKNCSYKINKHSSASEQHIRDALNYMVDKEPSLVWTGGPGANVYMGGYKSAINIPFLKSHSIGLILNASGTLEDILGPKYVSALRKRRAEEVQKEIKIHWIDAPSQKLHSEEILDIMIEMNKWIQRGSSVLVHCAQGKSRSGVIALSWILFHHQVEGMSVEEGLNLLKECRPIADPNEGFLEQLKAMERNGFFKTDFLNKK